MGIRSILMFVLLIAAQYGIAQDKVVDSTAYGSWKRIAGEKISFNGAWVAYTTVYHDEEKENPPRFTVVRTADGKTQVLDSVESLDFIGKGDWIMYRKQEKTFLYNLRSHTRREWKTTAYTQAPEGTDYLVYNRFVPASDGQQAMNDLVIYDIRKNDSIVENRVKSFRLLRNGNIIYSREDNGIAELRYGEPTQKPVVIYRGTASDFDSFSLNSNEEEGTFTTRSGTEHILWHFNLRKGGATRLLDFNTVPWSDSLYDFSRMAYDVTAGSRFIPLQLQPLFDKYGKGQPSRSDTEVWKWNEGAMVRRQFMLRGSIGIEQDPVYVYDLETHKVIRGAGKGDHKTIFPETPGPVFFMTCGKQYDVEVDWTFNEYRDIYAINLITGTQKLVAEKTDSSPYWNPEGTFAVWYDAVQKSWMVLDATDEEMPVTPLPDQPGYSLTDTVKDMGKVRSAYGIAGWLDQGNTVVFYDEYDLRAIDLTGKKDRYSLTSDFGRENKVTLRLYGSQYKADLSAKTIVLTGFDHKSKARGIYELHKGKVKKLAASPDYDVHLTAISGDGNHCLFTRESYTIFPDLWYGTRNFTRTRKLTDINPQQKEYRWGKAALIGWTNYNGKRNEGLLYVPDHYDPSKTYPVLVHFYEKHTPERHQYHYPQYSTSNIEIPRYLSRGYIVFQPDVHYTPNAPGESAYNAVVSGLEDLVEKKVAHRGKIGIQGHSFGGYQTSYLITRTDMFDAAVVGSGVSNFTSNYFSYRGNGLANMFKYENDQYRMEGSFFEFPEAYMENSPLFHAEGVHTPVLIFHNQKDRAVPFEEGQALFFALRRLGKPAWLINYKQEGHTLSDMSNRKDWTKRMDAFFDYFLADGPKPGAMKLPGETE